VRQELGAKRSEFDPEGLGCLVAGPPWDVGAGCGCGWFFFDTSGTWKSLET